VIDAEDLRLVEQGGQEAVELLGALEVVSERLFEDQERCASAKTPESLCCWAMSCITVGGVAR
jgi:hypothetical protein